MVSVAGAHPPGVLQPYADARREVDGALPALARSLGADGPVRRQHRQPDGDERLVMLSRIAMSVEEAMRGRHVTHVFCYQGKPLLRRRSRS